MNLNELLKNFRVKNNMTQEQLAKKLYVSHQTISKWEQGINIPSVDNLLILSDLYNISLDELIRGGNYLQKPFVMGKRNSLYRIILFIVLLLMLCLLIIGIWDISILFLPIVFVTGIFLILPMVINDYWILEKKGIFIKSYPKSTLKRLKKKYQSLMKSDDVTIFIPYNEIKSFEIIYNQKDRYSPFDYRADDFFIRIISDKECTYNLLVETNFVKYLPQIVSYLDKKNILIIDNSNIIKGIIKKEFLFDYVRK